MAVNVCAFLYLLSLASSSVIIPEELPSLLSVAYSNIPPIKKGSDSRVGFGFAFGNHADFQVVLELGPQTNTMNLTGQPFGAAPPANAKRQAPPPPHNKNREKNLQANAGNYLQQWAHKMRHPAPPAASARPRPGDVPDLEQSVVELIRNDKGEYEIHQPGAQLAPGALAALRTLYGPGAPPQRMSVEKKRSEAEVKKITEDLSNVDLD